MFELLDFPVRAEIRSLSPFVYKAEALLALCGCDYRKQEVHDVALLPHGKVPVLRDGDRIIPDSSLIQRVYLPLEDDEHMPPEGKNQLTEEETAVLAFWIQSGAKADATIGQLKPDEAASKAIAHVIGNLPEVAPVVAKTDAPPKPVVDEKIVAETIGRVTESGASLMAIAQDTPELRFSALNVAGDYTDDQLPMLKPVGPQLKWNDLARTKVTDKGLAHLSEMSNLTRLHLENTGVTDAGLAHLTGLSNLEYLNLYGTQVTDAGLQKLAGLKKLKKVFLWQSKATDAGAKKLAAAIPGLEVNTGWKLEPVVLAAATPKPAAAPKPAPKPEPKPAPKPAPKPEPKPAPKPSTVDPMFNKALAELKATADETQKRADTIRAEFNAAIKAVETATKKAEALKAQAEKAAKVAAETKAALAQLQKAAEASK